MSPRACSRSPECSVGLFQHLPGSQRLTGDQRVRQEVARETPRPKRKGLGKAKARTLTAEESGVRDQGLRGAPRAQGRVLGRDELRGWQASREHPGCEAGQGADSRSPTSRIRTSFFMLEARRGRTRPARMERTPHAGSAQPVAPLSHATAVSCQPLRPLRPIFGCPDSPHRLPGCHSAQEPGQTSSASSGSADAGGGADDGVRRGTCAFATRTLSWLELAPSRAGRR